MSQRIKLIYLIGQLGLGGSERQLYLLLKHMDKSCYEIYVVVFNPSPNLVLDDALQAEGVHVLIVPDTLNSIWQRTVYLYRLFQRIRPTMIHSWTLHDNAYAGVVGWLARIPYRWGSVRGSVHDEGFQRLPGIFKWLSLWSVSCLVVNAQAIRNELIRLGYPPNRIEVLPNCVEIPVDDSPAELEEFGISREQRVLGLVGNIRRVKNHLLFVDAMARILPDYPDVYAIIIGHPIPGHEEIHRMLLRKIEEINLSQRIILTGFRDDITALMHRFYMVCLTSDSEGTPNVLLEAMTASRPVVATNVGGVPDIIQHERNGLLVQAGSIDQFKKAVCTLLDHPEQAVRLGRIGREMVEADFNCSIVVQKLLHLYTQTWSSTGGPRINAPSQVYH